MLRDYLVRFPCINNPSLSFKEDCGEYALIKSLLVNGVYTYIYVYTGIKKKLRFLMINSLTNMTN